jgi:hypothetical protein
MKYLFAMLAMARAYKKQPAKEVFYLFSWCWRAWIYLVLDGILLSNSSGKAIIAVLNGDMIRVEMI